MKIYYTNQERTILKNILSQVIDLKNLDSRDSRKFKSLLNRLTPLKLKDTFIKVDEKEAKIIANILHQILEHREFKTEEEKEEFNQLPEHDRTYAEAYNTLILVLLEKITKKINIG